MSGKIGRTMKYVLVVNPCAGGRDSSGSIAAAVSAAGIEAEIYCTTGPRDATRFVGSWLAAHPGEEVRFYACGGDGTLNEVVTGVLDSGQTDRVEVGGYPCGSGNDFVRCWPEGRFHDIASQCSAPSIEVDVLRVGIGDGHRYAVNTLNFGFEAAVCRTMSRVRRHPLLGGRMAYTTGIVHSLLHERRHRCTIYVDGAIWYDAKMLLLSMANGQWAGGGYHCARRANPQDGLIDVMGVRPLSVLRFVALIKYYKNGELIDRKQLRDIVRYDRGRRVSVDAGQPYYIAADGELIEGCRFEVECLHKALRFIVPTK